MSALLPVDDAIARLLEGAEPIGAETVPLDEAAGRVLAGPVRALRTQPPFDASAMDGYAVRAEDVATVPARLKVIGVAAAGRQFAGAVGKSEAVRIFTGAPVPQGADTIAIQENVRKLDGDAIEVFETVAAGRHIRRKGLDFAEGDLLLEKGRALDAAALSLAAAANHPALPIVRKPLVAIIATGDELLPPGSEPGPDQIIASNAYGVAALAKQAGARVLDLGIAPDRIEAISALVERALGEEADVIVTLGGASVGDFDLVQSTALAEGLALDFYKVAMRPGKPLMAGRLRGTPMIGLPGNPVSAMVCGRLFVQPAVEVMLGLPGGLPAPLPARLTAPVDANGPRTHYMRAQVAVGPDGWRCTPASRQDSSLLSVLADANALMVRQPADPARAIGEVVEFLWI